MGGLCNMRLTVLTQGGISTVNIAEGDKDLYADLPRTCQGDTREGRRCRRTFGIIPLGKLPDYGGKGLVVIQERPKRQPDLIMYYCWSHTNQFPWQLKTYRPVTAEPQKSTAQSRSAYKQSAQAEEIILKRLPLESRSTNLQQQSLANQDVTAVGMFTFSAGRNPVQPPGLRPRPPFQFGVPHYDFNTRDKTEKIKVLKDEAPDASVREVKQENEAEVSKEDMPVVSARDWEKEVRKLENKLVKMEEVVKGLTQTILDQEETIKSKDQLVKLRSQKTDTASETPAAEGSGYKQNTEMPSGVENEKSDPITEPLDIRSRPEMSICREPEPEPKSEPKSPRSEIWKKLNFILCGYHISMGYEKIDD